MNTQKLASLGLLFLISATAQSENSPFAGMRFEIRYPTTAANAESGHAPSSHKELRNNLAALQKQNPDIAFSFQDDCAGGHAIRRIPCFTTQYGYDLAPPYDMPLTAAAAAVRAAMPQRGTVDDWRWARVADVIEGNSVLAEWKTKASKGELFDCNDAACTLATEVTGPAKSQADETWLGTCRVRRTGDTFGAPGACRQFAVQSSRGAWLRVWTGRSTVLFSMGRPDFALQFVPIKEGSFIPLMEHIRPRIVSALNAPPLQLEAANAGQSAIVGSAGYRASAILDGWREIVTVRVDVEPTGRNGLGIIVATTLYLNRQNTANSKDWHLPTDPQQQAYVHEILQALTASLTPLCSPSQPGTKVRCTLARELH